MKFSQYRSVTKLTYTVILVVQDIATNNVTVLVGVYNSVLAAVADDFRLAYVIGVDADDEAGNFSPRNSARLLNVLPDTSFVHGVSAQIVGSLLMAGLENVAVVYENSIGTLIFLIFLNYMQTIIKF